MTIIIDDDGNMHKVITLAELDKIRAEIQKIYIGYRNGYEIMADVLQIIDAYQTESEDEE